MTGVLRYHSLRWLGDLDDHRTEFPPSLDLLHFTFPGFEETVLSTIGKVTMLHQQVYPHHSPTACGHYISVSHFGNSCNISNLFNMIIFVAIICGQCIGIVLWCHESCQYKMAELIAKCGVFSLLHQRVVLLSFSISFCLLGPPYFLRHSNTEIKPINNYKGLDVFT